MKLKKFISAFLCLCIITAVSACGTDKSELPKEIELSGSFEVHFIDVGQGDASLILCNDKSMLIDGGKPEASSVIYTYLKKLNIEKLDYIVCSHADDDHIGGLSAPLAKMKVENILAPETPSDSRSYKSMIEKADAQGIEIVHPQHGESMDFAESKIHFYGPVTEDETDRNNSSVVMKVVYGDTSFLFTGDAERKEEQQILDMGYDISATVLKVGHHGSRNSTTYPFLRKIMPQYAVISVGDNSYGHPTEDALSRLRDADVRVYRTDMQGDIIVKSDGKTVSVKTAKNGNIQTNPTEKPETNVQAETAAVGYIANKNTKKFHLPSCSAVEKMNEENKVYLNCTSEEAAAKGYTSCKMCNP